MADDWGSSPTISKLASGVDDFNRRAAQVQAFIGRHWRPFFIGAALLVTWAFFRFLIGWAIGVALLYLVVWLGAQGRLTSLYQRAKGLLRRAWYMARSLHVSRGSLSVVWSAPPQDSDHAWNRAEWARTLPMISQSDRTPEGKDDRRRLLLYHADLTDGLLIRGDDPYRAITTRPERAASAPASLGAVGAAAVSTVLRRWHLVALALLTAAAALLYARGEALEVGRDRERMQRVAAEEAALGWQTRAQQAQADLADWQARHSQDLAALIEESRRSRDLMERSMRRSAALTQRSQTRAQTITNTPGPVDLSDSLRDLTRDPAASVPGVPSPPASGDPAG
jgi:hypothetical protein